MKVSKVDHRRTAVAVSKDGKNVIKGIIYDAPIKKESSNVKDKNTAKGKTVVEKKTADKDLKEVMKGLITTSSRLYSPFNNKSGIDKSVKDLKQCYKDFVMYYVTSESLKGESFNPPQIKTRWNPKTKKEEEVIVKAKISPEKVDLVINELVDKSLRKSLQKTIKIPLSEKKHIRVELPDLIKKSIKYYCIDGETSELNNQEKYELFSYILEDRYKIKERNKIIKSIENQSTKVKVAERDGHKLLKLAVADNTKNDELWDFLIRYAEGDSREQKVILCDIKYLIALFVCGSRISNKKISTDEVWKQKWSDYGVSSSDKFEPIPKDEEEHRDSLENSVSISNQIETKNYQSFDDKRDISYTEAFIRKANMDHYRDAVKVCTDKDKQSIYWLRHFESTIEKLFSKASKRKEERIKAEYLCEYLWKDFFSFVAGKYIDLGKGVYHFAMPEQSKKAPVCMGYVQNRYNKGISSFDYERIKANEELDRNIATYTTFASNVFAKAVIKPEFLSKKTKNGNYGNSDILSYSDEDFSNLKKIMNPDARRNVLQFWNGQSRFADQPENYALGELCIEIKDSLSTIRNSSVHYSAKFVDNGKSKSVVEDLLKKDLEDIKKIYAAKYYSNNVWMFYGTGHISKLMEYIYTGESNLREAQIPAFNSILKKKDVQATMNEIWGTTVLKNVKDTADIEKFRSMIYFVWKELYYGTFLRQENLKQTFIEYIKTIDNEIKKDNKRKAPWENFSNRIKAVNKDGVTFGELCQFIMTDYNLQNQGKKSVLTADQNKDAREKKTGESYQHFPILLHQTIRGMFIEYIKNISKDTKDSNDKNSVLWFMKNPTVGHKKELEEFIAEIAGNDSIELYKSLEEITKKDKSLLSWYVMAHFLMPKQLNHLIGDIKNYIQYINNIDQRAGSVHNNKSEYTLGRAQYYEKVVTVLEFALQYIGRVSNKITDYFTDDEAYASFLSKFVGFGSTASDLRNFCSESGLYHDGTNPILNRNIVYAKMYGNEKILGDIYNKVTEEDIKEWMNLKGSKVLKKVFESGECQEKTQQEELSKFQKQKNHVELVDIAAHTDIINDFMAQFISWAYLRERDLMYFQLGIHYLRLFYGSKELEEKYHKLIGDNINIKEGALLYQIKAMYTHEDPIFKIDKDGKAVEAGKPGSTGASVKSFTDEYCGDDLTYDDGLSLFEDINQHYKLGSFRNDIAHMRYMAAPEKSIMDMLSEIYRSFFIYDTKLKKSVSFIVKNILLRYGVIADLNFAHKGETFAEESNNLITIKKLTSDKYTYKPPVNTEKGNKVKKEDSGDPIFIRNDSFLKVVRKLLEYKSSETTQGNIK